MSFQVPKLTVDGVLFEKNQIVLVKRKHEPFQGKWALPGGFVEYGETTVDAVVREVFEETGLNSTVKDLLGVYSDPKRDPRGHTVTVVYLLKRQRGELRSGDDAVDVRFFNVDELPELSFDHEKIIDDARRKKS